MRLMWILSCKGLGAPHPRLVQGSTVLHLGLISCFFWEKRMIVCIEGGNKISFSSVNLSPSLFLCFLSEFYHM